MGGAALEPGYLLKMYKNALGYSTHGSMGNRSYENITENENSILAGSTPMSFTGALFFIESTATR